MTGVRIQTEQLHCTAPIFPPIYIKNDLWAHADLPSSVHTRGTFERQSTVTMEMKRRLCLSLLTIKKKEAKNNL